jgi:hypothetical protein
MTIQIPFYFIISPECDENPQLQPVINSDHYFQFMDNLGRSFDDQSVSSSFTDHDEDYLLEDDDDDFIDFAELESELNISPLSRQSEERQLLELSRALEKNPAMLARFEEYEDARELRIRDSTVERKESDSM